MTFQKAVLAYISSQQLTKKEEKKLREAFELLDEDKNGSISKEELTKGFMIIYKDEGRAKEDVERVMRHTDINQNGAIDYNGNFIAL
jgi:Ca2+-binding EF-hand superfamily protein